MQGNIYIEVFPTFLAKKSYDWWITRRRMEIYTKISKRKYLVWSQRNRGKFTPRMGCANLEGVVRVLCEFCTSFAQVEGVVRISHKPGAVVFRRPYLPHFRSKSYTVWSVRFLTSWALKWYIECRKWTSESAPKVQKKTTAVVLCFPLSSALSLHTLND